MGRPAIYPDCRAIVIGRKLAFSKQGIGDLRRPTHRHDDVLRRTCSFGILAVIQLCDDCGRNDTNQSVSGTDRLCRGGDLSPGKITKPPTNCTTVPVRLSLWYAERSKRLVRAPGLGVLNQCLPGRVAPLCAGKFLGRNHGAVGNTKPANDD